MFLKYKNEGGKLIKKNKMCVNVVNGLNMRSEKKKSQIVQMKFELLLPFLKILSLKNLPKI